MVICDILDVFVSVSEKQAKKAGAEVVKQSSDSKLSGLVYPLLQALDEQYLDVDIQFGGIDQRKIFTFAEENLPKIHYQKRIHLMNQLLPSLRYSPSANAKMSASDPNSKIDCLDNEAIIRKKISKAFCEEGNPDNALFQFIRLVLFPIYGELQLKRPAQYGGDKTYEKYDQLEADFIERKLSACDVKELLVTEIDKLLSPIRRTFESPVLHDLYIKAYGTI
jgi:tyrosyl-tRNA synthetase